MNDLDANAVMAGVPPAHDRRRSLAREVLDHFADRKKVIIGLVALTLLVYGFELFNFNLTIDEEVHAFSLESSLWVSTQRWGLYVLNRLLLPYTVVPVLPLALGLTFHLLSVFVLLKAWDVVDPIEQFVVGALVIATPTMAYIYMFNTIAYAMGAGLFLAALSLAMFRHGVGARRYLAAIPAGFALAIYQPFGLALVCVYVVSLIRSDAGHSLRQQIADITHMVGVGLAAAGVYLFGHAIFMAVVNEPTSSYVEQFIDLGALRDRPIEIARSVVVGASRVYRGDASIFAHTAWALPILLLILFLTFAWRMGTSNRHPIARLLLLLLFPFILLIPFLGGLLSGGHVALRFLVAVPFALAGVMAVGLPRHPAGRMAVIVATAFVLLQFATATNSLFGSSHLALQQDRALGTQLILQIEVEMSRAPVTPQFLEVVGVPSRSVTQLMPQSETFGASFFEWEQGNVHRIVFFLRTLGFDDLSGLGAAERGEHVATGSAMPIFPAPGSVVVEGNVMIVKFGPYTPAQTRVICDHSPDAEVCSG